MIGDPERPAALGSTAWAVALNKSATIDDVEITLLAFTLVGRVVRISGLVRLRQADRRLVHVPDLAISPGTEPRCRPLGAHMQPHGDLSWLSWDFEHPLEVFGAYEGRIEQVDLAYRSGGRAEVTSHGPWVFNFRLLCRAPSSGSAPHNGGRVTAGDA